MQIVSPAIAQEPTAGSNRGILIRGFAIAHFNGIEKVELRQETKLLLDLRLATGQLDAGQNIKIRQFSFGITKEGVFAPMGQIKLPDVESDFILVFVPTKDNYRVFSVRADDPDFKGNDALLFNFTPYRIHAVLGTKRQAIDSTKSAKLSPSFEADATFFQALFAYEPEQGKIAPFSNTRWPVNGNLKAIVFVSMDAETNRPVYSSVVDLASRPVP